MSGSDCTDLDHCECVDSLYERIKVLEQRIIDLQGHDDLSYIDKKLGEQGGKWVGLTDDEVNCWELPDTPTVFEFAKFIEAKLKEKNGG